MTKPQDALALLKDGNARFLEGRTDNRDLIARVHETASRPSPFAVILGCMDSRVPPELVFDQGIGDVFSVRIAGNYASEDIVGCLEFAAHLAHVNLIVVLGHTDCIAIKSACDGIQLGSLTHTLSHLEPALRETDSAGGARASSNTAFVRAVAEQNVRHTLENITEHSPVLREAVASGDIEIVGAMHEVATGRVFFLES
jgi:carbonic anhydrase